MFLHDHLLAFEISTVRTQTLRDCDHKYSHNLKKQLWANGFAHHRPLVQDSVSMVHFLLSF